MSTFYAVRYVAGTPLAKRKHEFTVGRFAEWAAAEDHRTAQPVADLLEVVAREDRP